MTKNELLGFLNGIQENLPVCIDNEVFNVNLLGNDKNCALNFAEVSNFNAYDVRSLKQTYPDKILDIEYLYIEDEDDLSENPFDSISLQDTINNNALQEKPVVLLWTEDLTGHLYDSMGPLDKDALIQCLNEIDGNPDICIQNKYFVATMIDVGAASTGLVNCKAKIVKAYDHRKYNNPNDCDILTDFFIITDDASDEIDYIQEMYNKEEPVDVIYIYY